MLGNIASGIMQPMTRHDKKIDKWLRSTPKEAPVESVLAVLDRYFSGRYERKSGSHIVVRDERLWGVEGLGADGQFVLAVKRGQAVKGVYLKKIAAAIEILKRREETKDE